MKVVAVVPALNEELAIGGVVDDLLSRGLSEVVVVDNGSTDRTAEVAALAGARVVREAERGYGSACIAGVGAAWDADVVVFLDGDATEVTEDLGVLVSAIRDGRAQIALGVRVRLDGPGAMAWQQRAGNRLLAVLVNKLTGAHLTDLPSLKVVDGATLRALDVHDRRFGWTAEILTRAAMRQCSVMEFPRGMKPRKGRSKVTGSFIRNARVGFAIGATIIRVWREERRRTRGAVP